MFEGDAEANNLEDAGAIVDDETALSNIDYFHPESVFNFLQLQMSKKKGQREPKASKRCNLLMKPAVNKSS